jgi:hypothetical protein
MADTIVERIHAAIAAKLAEIIGVVVERNRDTGFQEFGSKGSLNLIEGDQSPDFETTQVSKYFVRPSVEGYVQKATPAELGPALNALYGLVLAKLWEDRTLGGLAIDVREGERAVQIGARVNQRPVMGFQLELEVEFWTAEGDPTALAP